MRMELLIDGANCSATAGQRSRGIPAHLTCTKVCTEGS